MSPSNPEIRSFSRRALLKNLALAPLLFRAAPLHGWAGAGHSSLAPEAGDAAFDFADVRLKPRYPAQSPLADILRRVPPGSDEFLTEKYAVEIESLLREWGQELKQSPRRVAALARLIDPSITAAPLVADRETTLRSGPGVKVLRRSFAPAAASTREQFLKQVQDWLSPLSRVDTAEFDIAGIEKIADAPLRVRAEIRYDLVGAREPGQPDKGQREERVGAWKTQWSRGDGGGWTAQAWEAGEETVGLAAQPAFVDVTRQALGETASYRDQLSRGVDYWRTVLDGACGIDVYGNNGVAAGDYDGDGFDDLYVCQPAGLPNRLYRNRGDGTFEDATEKAGVGVLDGTACALFADFDNKGLQDLLVVCGSGPLLFVNQGDGTFARKRDAFQFQRPPQGTFTHAAVADYDGDGQLDIYLCLYSYYLGLDQYRYPVPYFDARNGPPNFLFRNVGNATFVDRTEAAGLNAENDRYSFACAWGDASATGRPDLYVANDFGRSNLYRNNGDGTFTAVSSAAGVDDPGAGMSACWADVDNDGRQDIYVSNMWSAAGQRVAQQENFQPKASEDVRGLFRHHARGNSLYRNQKESQGGRTFRNVAAQAGAEMGRWAWCSDAWDFDHDGHSDLYVANGYISAPERSDLASFFWRQVVGKSPLDATPSLAYERGWQALNELIRSDSSWSGYERNVMFANLGDGSFAEVSGAVGLDCVEDSRAFALADLDHDGRLELVLKNRNAPQLRILSNEMADLGQSIAFRLTGRKSNRDAIGAAITVEAGRLRQTKYLQAGSGFLAQHSKEVFFGLGSPDGPVRATIRWPSGLAQQFEGLPPQHRIEIEEGSPGFAAKAFAEPAFARPPAPAETAAEILPAQVATWLIDPLKAPEFSLPDLTGALRGTEEFKGAFALLFFWSTSSPLCREQLRLLSRNQAAFSAAGLKIAAINLDGPELGAAVRSIAAQDAYAFPVLLATEEVAGVYNIVYRYLYDRRRDLGIPTSFLLDREGRIVKVYQGALEPQAVLEDAKTIPATAADLARSALPFAGSLYQGSFERNDFTYGVAMFQHGYLEQAEASFRDAVATSPDDPEAYYNLGTLSLRRNDFEQARQYLKQTLKLKPDYPEAWNNLGMMDAQQGRAEEAIRDFEQSLRLRPDYATALLNLGNVYRRQGSPDKAQECLTKALALQPDDPEVSYSLGMLCAQQNQADRAAQYLRRAIDLRPDYAEARNNLGVLLVRERDYAQAEEQFQACMRLVPGFDQSYMNLARLYVMRNDKQKAVDTLRLLLQLQPQNAAAKQALGMLE
jgi:Flp pilus assembly protein TadD/peroxiredoxin